MGNFACQKFEDEISWLSTLNITPLYPCQTTGKWVVLDSDTVPLNKLTVIGVLEIPDTMNSSSNSRTARSAPEYNTVVLDAVYISIQVSVIKQLLFGTVRKLNLSQQMQLKEITALPRLSE